MGNSSTKPSYREIGRQYREWFQNATAADIRHQFLTSLKEGGGPWLGPAMTPAKLEYFDRLVAGFYNDGQLQITPIINHLKHAHSAPAQVQAIQSATSILETLIISHACFPFSSPVPLTKDTFCQSILLLADQCGSTFGQGLSSGSDVMVRPRTKERRLQFIYTALASPPTGAPTHDDILDVVCRVKYPWHYCAHPKTEPIRHPISTFLPLAQRLEPLQEVKFTEPAISSLQPLLDLVAAFPQRYKPVADITFGGGQDTITAEQFVVWAKRVGLIDVLADIFEAFLPKVDIKVEIKSECRPVERFISLTEKH